MKAIVAIVALVVAGPALAQGLTTQAPGQSAQKRTNYALASNTVFVQGVGWSTPWTSNSSTAVGVAGAPASCGGGSWTESTNTANGGGPYSPVGGATTPNTETRLALSACLAKASGTGYASIIVGCSNAPSLCTCLRDDGGSCSATVHSTNYCRADVTNLGTTPIRLTVFATCASGSTSHEIVLVPGQINVAVGTTRFTGIQLEVGARSKPSKICVTTTAAKTCKN